MSWPNPGDGSEKADIGSAPMAMAGRPSGKLRVVSMSLVGSLGVHNSEIELGLICMH